MSFFLLNLEKKEKRLKRQKRKVRNIVLFFRKGKKMSDGSEKQMRINDLLNASHNSQAEKEYLRQRILEIFEEDEHALQTQIATQEEQVKVDFI